MSDEKPKKQQPKKEAARPAKEAKEKAPAAGKASKSARPKEKVVARLSLSVQE